MQKGKFISMKAKFKQKLKIYSHDPLSLVIYILVNLAVIITVSALLFIVTYILVKGIPHLKPSFFEIKYTTENISVFPAIINTFIMVGFSLLISVPLGISCAIYLVEYASRKNKLVKYIRITTETLSGIPSIIYGLFGMLFFVTTLGWGMSILAGSFTVSIMILPLIIRSTEEALKSVSDTFREASYGIGAGKLRTVFVIVLPSAIPGILAGVILAIGRIIGETAALIYTAGSVAKIPDSLMGSGRTLSIHMYALSKEGLHSDQAYATAVILLLTVLFLNTIASVIAKKLQSK